MSTKNKKVMQRHSTPKTLPTRSPPEGNSAKKKDKAKAKDKSTLFDKEKSIVPGKKRKADLGSQNNFTDFDLTQSATFLSAIGHRNTGKSLSDDTTWEKTVKKARGNPDGAENSQTPKSKKGDVSVRANVRPSMEKRPKKPFQKLKENAQRMKNKMGIKGKEKDENKKDLHQMKKKERKTFRKSKNDTFELEKRAKVLWEELRRHDVKPDKKKKVCEELYGMIKGKGKELIFKHDTGRVFQSLLKFGPPEIRTAIFEELKDQVLEMVKLKYAKNIVRKMLKYGTKEQRSYIFTRFHGKVRKLLKHTEAAEIIEYCYNEYANANQRASFIEEFYGPSFVLFKNPNTKTLDEIMKAEPKKKATVLRNMKESLTPLADKNVIRHSMVHRLFYEYFLYCDEKMRSEMIEVIREVIVNMLHTKEGAKVAMQCVWHGTAKDRKVIIKSFKTFVVKISKEEHGHMVLLALFDVVDDTKLVFKAIIEEILKSIDEIAFDPHGIKVIEYLLSPRDPLYFHPDIVSLLEQGDNNVTSKKGKESRRKELLQYISEPMLKFISEHTRKIVMNNSALLLMMTILTHVEDDTTEAMKSIVAIAAEPFTPGNLENFHIIEHPAGHIALKKLITGDRERMKNNKVLFSKVLMDNIPTGTLKSWSACNRGCFTILNLLELDIEEIANTVKEELVPIKKSLSKSNSKGAQILSSKIK